MEDNFSTITENITEFNIHGKEKNMYSHKTDDKIISIPHNLKNKINTVTYLKYEKNEEIIYFSIRRFYNHNKRLTVLIYSYKPGSPLTRSKYYTSKSDGSFWRYCIKDDDSNRFNKGYNYISSTFINLYLQHFIDSNKDKYVIEDLSDDCCPTVTNIKTKKSILYNRVFNSGEDVISNNIFFKTINEIFPPVRFFSEYKNCISRLLNNLSKLISENNNLESIDFYSKLFCTLTRHEINKDILLTDETSRRSFFTSLKNVLSEIFLERFNIIRDTKKCLYKKNFLVGEINHRCHILSINIFDKIYARNYVLYYMDVKIFGRSSSINNRFKNILHIIPNENSITIDGLDNRYVACGAFINKLYDYADQTPITRARGHDESRTEDYRLVGDIFNYDFLP